MKVFITACLLAGVIVFPASADIIYFKDGMKTVCQERSWEEGDQIKCEYAGWVISYQKTDILRIVKTTRPPEATAPGDSAATNATAAAEKTAQPDNKPPAAQSESAAGIPKKIKTEPDRGSGPVFYDPRRPFKYWTDENSKHRSYQEAIGSLAAKYKTTPEWIQAHMGDTNDLAQIHSNLAKLQPDQILPQPQPTTSSDSETVFYNPRRPYPYWTDRQSKHKSYREAIQRLADEYDRSPEWIKQNMGATNDLDEIHRNLEKRTAADSLE